MSRENPPLYSSDTRTWAEDLSDYLQRNRSLLSFKDANDRAAEDGILLWSTDGYPVVSKGGEFRQIVLADGHGDFSVNSDISFTVGTAVEIPWVAVGTLEGLSLNGTSIVFEEEGHYMATFSAQIYSTSSSTVNFAFWSRITSGGSSTDAYTMRNALHQNGAALVVSRSAVFSVLAGDSLKAIAAADSSSASLKAFPANAIGAGEPLSPAATLSIMRVQQ